MPQLEGLRIKNYRALKSVTIGKLWNRQDDEPKTPLTVVIGKNVIGSSTLLDAFVFLAEALKMGVELACYAQGRGGFSRWLTKDADSSECFEFEVYYRESKDSRLITYKESCGRCFSTVLLIHNESLIGSNA